jgi:hypothetical protein
MISTVSGPCFLVHWGQGSSGARWSITRGGFGDAEQEGGLPVGRVGAAVACDQQDPVGPETAEQMFAAGPPTAPAPSAGELVRCGAATGSANSAASAGIMVALAEQIPPTSTK